MADPAFPRDVVQAVLASAFDVVLDRHLEAVAPAQLGLWTLLGLQAIAPGLTPELRAGTLLLSEEGRLIAARPVPAQGVAARSAGPLAVAVAALMDAAWRASPPLREAGPSRMLQAGFAEAFRQLDPYSRYLAPAEAAEARTRRIGQSALGLRLGAGPRGSLIVAEVVPGATADRIGLRAGDRLLAIDGEPVSARRLAEAVALLEGPTGSGALLRVQRGGRRFDLVLPREVVPPDTLQAERRDGILWLRVAGFANDTDRRLAEALEQGIEPRVTRGIVLDLRGNRGGLLGQAVGMASAFLTGGVVARTAGRHPDAARTYLADDDDRAAGLPLVVLVDGRTASAAEIVAAALADRGRAVVIGSGTTGKGLVQVVAPLADGGELHVSWARVLAPSGRPVQGLGVLPALCSSRGEEATARLLAALRQGEVPVPPGSVPPAGGPPGSVPPAGAPAAGAPGATAAGAPGAPAAGAPGAPAAGAPGATDIAALRAACPPAEGGVPGRDIDAALAQALLDNPAAYAAALGR